MGSCAGEAPPMPIQREEQPMNIAARAAKWSAANWKKATFGWLAFVVVATVAGQAVGGVRLTESQQGSGESARAEATLVRADLDRAANEVVIVRSDKLTVGDPGFDRVIVRVVSSVAAMPEVEGVRSPLARAGADQISKDRHSALVQFLSPGFTVA